MHFLSLLLNTAGSSFHNLSTMLALIAVFFATLLLIDWINSKPKNYPPGPLCLPIVGSAPFVQTMNFHFYLEKLKKTYGPVIGFKFGSQHVIGITGTKEVREVLSREEFQGRPEFPLIEKGIMFSEGAFWTEQRRFTVRHMRMFGFGKNSTETVVLDEANEFFQNVLRQEKMVQVSGLFTLSAINVLWAMVGGHRFSHDNEEFKYLLTSLQRRFRIGNVTGGLLTSFSFLTKIFRNFENFKEQHDFKMELDKFLQRIIDSHKATQTEEPRDFMDVYLSELQRPDKTALHSSFKEDTLKNICVDLFSAGSESVGNYIGFCVLYCVLYPEWQERLYKEIMSNDALTPYLDNKPKFGQVEAFLSEVARCNTIATIAVPHKALEDTELGGYFIPKGASLLVSLWSVLQDEEAWKDPKNFRPERFLDDSGNYKKDAGWLPLFGMGKRICPGETLARNIVFVFLIAMLREFKFSVPEGHDNPSTVCMPGLTNAPQPFYVMVTKR